MTSVPHLQKRIIRALQVTGVGWASLGFYRGIQDHDYDYQTDLKRYNEKMSEYNESMERYNAGRCYTEPRVPEKPHKYYFTSLLHGIGGTLFYVNPFFCLYYFSKELYRLEAYVRNIDDVKNKTYYKKL